MCAHLSVAKCEWGKADNHETMLADSWLHTSVSPYFCPAVIYYFPFLLTLPHSSITVSSSSNFQHIFSLDIVPHFIANKQRHWRALHLMLSPKPVHVNELFLLLTRAKLCACIPVPFHPSLVRYSFSDSVFLNLLDHSCQHTKLLLFPTNLKKLLFHFSFTSSSPIYLYCSTLNLLQKVISNHYFYSISFHSPLGTLLCWNCSY